MKITSNELGYYRVGDRVFHNKIPALIYSTQTNQHPEWYFHTDQFNSFDWTQEPVESLTELYRQRAQDIREKYSYVSLLYSAGSDSHNALMAFLDNGLKVDEVVVSWPVTWSEKQTVNADDYSIENYTSEWALTVKPRLKWLSDNHPDVKITIRDWGERLDRVRLSDEFLLTRNHNFSPYADLRWNNTEILDRVNAKNGVLLKGVDKPKICFHNGAYKIYFLDMPCQGSFPTGMPESNVEFFYWSGDACRLLCKQAHAIVKFFEINPNFKKFIAWPNSDPRHRQFYETVTRAVIYPDIDITVWQSDKATNMNVSWDVIFTGTEVADHFWQAYQTNWSTAKQVIDKKFFNKSAGDDTIIGFINGMWTIKEIYA